MGKDNNFSDVEDFLISENSWVGSKDKVRNITRDDLFQTTELMFLAHLCTIDDTDRQLKANKLGRIHHRLLYIAVKKPGKTVGEVLSLLRVTNQNIHRPLGELVDLGYVEQKTSSKDRRKRELHATKKGEDVFEDLMKLQFGRYRKVYKEVGKDAIREFWRVLWHIMDAHDRDWLLRDLKET
jgi:DNA-binding MarR family transcriptional regulator